MGQYWKAVNLTKQEFITPHKLGAGAKLGEQLGSHVGTALIILTAAMREHRGGGDLDFDTNYYSPERTNHSGSTPINKKYNDIAKRTIGRWAGDQITLVGDYSEDDDLPSFPEFSKVYGHCSNERWKDITDDVCAVIEHECGGVRGARPRLRQYH